VADAQGGGGTPDAVLVDGGPEVPQTVTFFYNAAKDIARIETAYASRKKVDTFSYTAQKVLTSIVTTWVDFP